ncbi:tape measure protein [Roseomonas genomospecies 6]|uniref:Tape measure protein N-terminal domain-containing protein n=1 Tax=Roseomonas genomospecies 6 TaxID=214106 RepID=A0A9W7NES4_9PROT|nr:tape measure protein [Roseomonas genomospecies 6]KAA0678071.1 hypothetical protein DS843_21040 [Roseomonas genomospecies 6]
MAELKVALKLTADGSALVGEVRLARSEIDKLGAAANDAGASLRGATGDSNVVALNAHRRATRGLTEDMGAASHSAQALQRVSAEAAASHRQAAAGMGDHAAAAREFGNATRAANDNADGLGDTIGMLVNGLKTMAGLWVVDQVRAFGAQLIASAAQAQQLERRLSSLVGTGAALAENQTWLAQTADRLGQSQTVMADSYTRLLSLARSGLVTIQQSRELTEGLANAQVKFAADVGRMGDVMYGLSQALASPVVQMEELNQVVEPLPGILMDLDRAAGLPGGGFRRLVGEGRVTSEMFRDTLIKALRGYAGEAEKAAGSVEAAYARMENASQRAKAELGKMILPGWVNLVESAAAALNRVNKEIEAAERRSNQVSLMRETTNLDDLLAERAGLEAKRQRYANGASGVYARRNLEVTDRDLADVEKRIDAALARLQQLRAALGDAGDGWAQMWGMASDGGADPAAVALDKLAGKLGLAADAVDLVITKNGLLTKSEADLRAQTETLTKVLALPPDQLKKLGISAADAAFILDQLREKLDPVTAAVAAMNRETAALGVAPKFRGLYQALEKAEQDKGRKLTDDEAINLTGAYAKNRAANSAEQVRLTREAAEAAEALARAQASGNPAAVANARANLKVAEALRDGVIVQADKAAYSQAVLREEMAGLAGQAGEAATVSSRQARQMLELAEATRRGGAAVAETTLRHQIENETLRVGAGERSELARRLTEEAAARRALAAAQFDRDLDAQIAATKALAAAEGESAKAVAETTIRNQVAAQVEREGVKADSDRAKAIAAKTAELAKWQETQGYNRESRARDRELQLAQAEVALADVSEAQRQRTIELLRYELDIREQFPTKTEEDIQALLRKKAVLLDRQDIIRFQNDVRETSRRISDDLAAKMFEKGGSILDWWRNLLKRMAIEIASTKFIMPIVQTVVGAVPGLFGIQAPAGGAGAGGLMGQAGNAGMNWATSKAMGWAGDKLGLTGAGGSITGAIDTWGATNLGIGTAATVPATPLMASGGAGGVGSGMLTGGGAQSVVGGQVASGTGLSSLASGVGAGAAAGGIVGGLVGTATNSKVAGGASGAVAGGLASYMMMGSAFGPWGIAAGAILGAVMGMLGTQKASVGPNSRSNLTLQDGSWKTGEAAADNGGDLGKTKGVTDAIATALNSLMNAAGIKNATLMENVAAISLMEKDGRYTTQMRGQKKDFSDQTAALTSLFGDVLTMVIEDGATEYVNKDNKYVAENVRRALVASVGKPVEEVVSNLTFAASDFAHLFDDAAKPSADQFSETLTAMSVQFQTSRDRAAELGLTTDGMVSSLEQATTRMFAAAGRGLKGLGVVDQIQSAIESWRKASIALMGAGLSPQPAMELLGAQLSAIVNAAGDGIEGLQRLTEAAAILRGMGETTGAAFAELRASQVREQVMGDLALQEMQARVELGQLSQDAYDRRVLEIQQRDALARVTDAGVRAEMERVQALQRAALAAKQDAAAATERAAALERTMSAAGDVLSDLDRKRADGSTGLTAEQRIAAVDSMLRRDLALARSNDPTVAEEALRRLTTTRQTAEDTYDAVYGAGSAETTAMLRAYEQSVRSLPAVQTWQQRVLEALAALPSDISANLDLKGRILEVYEPAVLQRVDPAVRKIVEQLVTLASQGFDFTAIPAAGQRVIAEALTRIQGGQPVTVLDFTAVPAAARRDVIETLRRLHGDAAVERFAFTALPPAAQRDLAEVLSRYRGALLVDSLDFTTLAPDDQRRLSEILTRYDRNQAVADLSYSSLPADAQRVLDEILTRNQGGVVVPALQFSTIAPDATRRLAELMERYGNRVLVDEFDWSQMPEDDRRLLTEVMGRYRNNVQVDQFDFAALPADDQRELAELLSRTLNGDAIAAWTPITLPGNATRTVTETVKRDVSETVTTAAMRDLTSGFQALQLQTTSVLIKQLDDLGRIIHSGLLNVVRAITANWSWGANQTFGASPHVLTTREAQYLATYADLADAWSSWTAWDPTHHYYTDGIREGRTFQNGGIVGRYQSGGLVDNGIKGVDSVLALYPDGSPIMVAGGEFVTPTPAVTPDTLPILEYIREHRRPPSAIRAYEGGGLVAANNNVARTMTAAGAPAPMVTMTVTRSAADVSDSLVMARSMDRMVSELAELRRERREDAARDRQLVTGIAEDQIGVAERQEQQLRALASGRRAVI